MKWVYKMLLLSIFFVLTLTACGTGASQGEIVTAPNVAETIPQVSDPTLQEIDVSAEIRELEPGLSVVEFTGDDGFDDFLAAGGASSDAEVAAFLTDRLTAEFDWLGGIFGCSTIAVESPEGSRLFGRNFDWNTCNALIVLSHPDSGYSSISTVNLDFIGSASGLAGAAMKLDSVRTQAALYAPLDGMNDQGLAVSVNMIQDNAAIRQDSEKPDITTTTAVRLLLNQAANVDEAIRLLEDHDLHGSMGMMIHFALADATGRSVAVEYIHNEMTVTETPVVTNFYLTPGEKYGIGTGQSMQRYNILMETLERENTLDLSGVADALNSVSKHNFGQEFESTEWSAVFDLTTGEARYYHRENYDSAYIFHLKGDSQ